MPSPQRRVIVTGAAGFIGFHLTRRLLDDGVTVLGIDNLNPYYDPALKRARLARIEGRNGFSFAEADIADGDRIGALFEEFRPTEVVTLAAQAGVRYSLTHPRAYVAANVEGFLNILEACRFHPVRHLLYASSSSVYGANRKVPFSEADRVDRPVSLYAATKRANELMAHTYAHLFGVPSSGLRFFTVYGPWGRPDMAYYLFTKAILESRPIEVFNGGRLSRDFTYIDDVVEALARLLDHPPAAEGDEPPTALFNIGNHTPVPLDRFIAAIETATGRTAARIDRPMQPGDVEATYADVEALSDKVGFAPKTSIEDGIGRFVRWYRDYYRI